MTDGISINSEVCHGKPVISGTRVLVSTILGALAGGDSAGDVAQDYGVSVKQVHAALEFAAGISDFQTVPYESVA